MTGKRVRNASPMAKPRFLSVGAVAKIFGVSAQTVYRSIHDGQIAVVNLRGRMVIPSAVVDKLEQDALDQAGVEEQSNEAAS